MGRPFAMGALGVGGVLRAGPDSDRAPNDATDSRGGRPGKSGRQVRQVFVSHQVGWALAASFAGVERTLLGDDLVAFFLSGTVCSLAAGFVLHSKKPWLPKSVAESTV